MVALQIVTLVILLFTFAPTPLGATPSVGDSGARSDRARVLLLLERLEPRASWQPQSLLRADLTGDRIADVVVAGRDGDEFLVGLIVGPVSEDSRLGTMRFRADNAAQGSLCSLNANIGLEDAAPILQRAIGPHATARPGQKAVRLSDGLCDAFHIFWNSHGKQFQWFRV